MKKAPRFAASAASFAAHLFGGCDGLTLTFDVNASTGALTEHDGGIGGASASTYGMAIASPALN